jgi:hypothetical protein
VEVAAVVAALLTGAAYSLPPVRLKRFPVAASLCIAGVRSVVVNLGVAVHFASAFRGDAHVPPAVWALCLFVLPFSFAIAVLKDVPDIEGDRRFAIRTFSVRLGAQRMFAVGLAALGFFLPDFLVGTRARKRRDAIGTALPDALDLLAVSVEAGLGFDGAVTKITEHMEGPLVDEFAFTLGEIRMGEARQDALKKMAGRVASPELASFIRAIIQADQLGISLGRILRVQAADSRHKRQMAAEEKAMKAPVKMLFPTVALIFPSMFIVILGPALLNLLKLFGG